MSNANIQPWQSHNRRKFKSCPRNQEFSNNKNN